VDPVTLGLVSMGVGGAVKTLGGLFGGLGQADLMRKEASLKLSALEEGMRRTEGQQTQVLSSTKARMAGTGFGTDSPSFSKYISTMATEFENQNKFTWDQGLKTVDLIRQGANSAEVGGFVGAAADLFGTGANMASLSKTAGLGA
jgi:hypothetical protein